MPSLVGTFGGRGGAFWFYLGPVALMALIFWLGPVEDKHMSDVGDMVFYWYFMVLSWLPLYVLCFWLPRWL